MAAVKVDVLASEAHFADHLAAVWSALPKSRRGDFMARTKSAADRVVERGFRPSFEAAGDRPVLVASVGDLRAAQRLGRTRIAIMEHGSGQSYGGWPVSARHSSYAGGKGRDAASLFLHPGPHPAARDAAAYPGARVEVVGSPLLDTLPARVDGPGQVVAVTFHFNSSVAPETMSAFPWARRGIVALMKDYRVIGHGHPRQLDALAPWYKRTGIELVRSFDEVCRRADLLVADNTSALYAFAASGRPVVVLNPPHYRRKINHGLRFWEAASVGIQVSDPGILPWAVERSFLGREEDIAAREAALDLVYAYRTGAAKRAADVLLDWASRPPEER